MRPDDANVVGNVHGGIILKMIEEAGCIVCTRHCNTQNGVGQGDYTQCKNANKKKKVFLYAFVLKIFLRKSRIVTMYLNVIYIIQMMVFHKVLAIVGRDWSVHKVQAWK